MTGMSLCTADASMMHSTKYTYIVYAITRSRSTCRVGCTFTTEIVKHLYHLYTVNNAYINKKYT